MKVAVLVLAVVALAACQADTPVPSAPAAPTAGGGLGGLLVSGDDDRCARSTFDSLIDAVNGADEARLAYLVGGSFISLTVQGSTTYESRVAVDRLLAVGRSGERWSLTRLDVNGRDSYYKGVHYGVVIRRSGPDVKDPYVDSAGKGVLDCPAGRVLIFGLGD
jgi:hypothetical protein